MAGYLIGETLRQQLRDTISRVRDMPEGQRPTRIETRFEDAPRRGSGSSVKLVSFVPPWSKGQDKTVTFVGTTDTATAKNVFGTVTGGCGTAHAAVFAQGGTWFLLAAECP